MIDRRQHCLDRGDRMQGGRLCASNHDHLDTEPASRLDLRISRKTTAVLGYHGIDTVSAKQRRFTIDIVGTAIKNEANVGEGERRLDRFDTSHEIEMLRGGFGPMGPQTTNRQEGSAWRHAKPLDCFGNRLDIGPTIARLRRPLRSAQCEPRNPDRIGSFAGVPGNTLREGVSCVDQKVEATFLQESGQPFRAAKTTAARRDRLSGRLLRSAGKRQKDIEALKISKPLRQDTGLTCTPQHQDTDFVHV